MEKLFIRMTPAFLLFGALGSTYLQMYGFYANQTKIAAGPPDYERALDLFLWWYGGANVSDIEPLGFLIYFAVFFYAFGSICWFRQPTKQNFLLLFVLSFTFFSYTDIKLIETCITRVN